METFNSQDFQDYHNEIRYLDDGNKSDDSLDDDRLTEDWDNQLKWFQEVGVNPESLTLDDDKEVEEDNLDEFLTSLTDRQATVVRKKIATLNNTIRKRKASRGVRDVRDVFSNNVSETSSIETRSRSETPNSLDSSISPCGSSPGSPADWTTQPDNASPTSSQGYHSNARNSPNSMASGATLSATSLTQPHHTNTAGTTTTTTTNLTYHFPPSSTAQVSTGPSSLGPPPISWRPLDKGWRPQRHPNRSRSPTNGDMDWDKSSANRLPPDGSADYSSMDSIPSSGNYSSRILPFGPDRRYRPNQPGSEDNSNVVKITAYNNIGSWYGGPNASAISSHSEEALSECDINVEVQDIDQEWDFDCLVSDKNEVQTFYSVSEKNGRTLISDLGVADIPKIQHLALLEFTILMDTYRIQYSKRKARRRRLRDDNVVFGVPLATLLQVDSKYSADCKIPLVLERMLNFLEKYGLHEEGILRVPGSAHKTSVLKMELEHNFYSNPSSVEKTLQSCSVSEVAAVLKQFIRELPTPLLTNDHIDGFIAIDRIKDRKDQLKAMKFLILLLPEVNRNVLWSILKFLGKVAEHEKENRMTIYNVAMIMAPNLFLAKKGGQVDLASEMELAAATSNLTKLMIEYREILFTVPGFILKQVRRQYESAIARRNQKENHRAKRWLLTKKPVKAGILRPINNEVDFQGGILRVQAPKFFNQQAWPIQLLDSTTVGEVVRTVLVTVWSKKQSSPSNDSRHVHPNGKHDSKNRSLADLSSSNGHSCVLACPDIETAVEIHFLHEVGGNIGDRRLPHDANVFAVYKENPNAEWIIRCHHYVPPAGPAVVHRSLLLT